MGQSRPADPPERSPSVGERSPGLPGRPGSIPPTSIVRSTLRALLEPRRLVPVLVVCVPLVILQGRTSRDPRAAALGAFFCLAFLVFAPVFWRILFPEGLELGHGAARLLLYAAGGVGVVLVVGVVIPEVLGMLPTLMTVRSGLLVSAALFVVGGWGLGRDIGMEASLRKERRRAEQLARAAEHAQLVAIRSHLDPHFLFNTLNAIAEWCREDGEVAERAVLQLSAILRAILAGVKQPAWPLAKEVQLVRDLLALYPLRDPSLVQVEWDLPSPLPDIDVLPMILLPLAENAVKHGPSAGHRGVIRIAIADGDPLVVSIENPGPYGGPRPGSEGLPTVESRIRLGYDGGARLRIGAEGGRTRVAIELPRVGPRRGAIV
jgi:two-component system, LytTR family, sensor histidine kinase AlgZ